MKHKSLIFIKTKQTARHMYVLFKLEYTYISKYKRVCNSILHERQLTQGCTCISISLDKSNIYMKLNVYKNREYKLKCKSHQN